METLNTETIRNRNQAIHGLRLFVFVSALAGLTAGTVLAQETQIKWRRLFDETQGQTGTWTPFQFPGLPDDWTGSLAQSFEVSEPFVGVGISSPTWNGQGAGYWMALYEWTGDYASSAEGFPIKEQQFENITDNGVNTMVWDEPAPPGQYLLVTDGPIPSDTGLVGHWGWVNSPFGTGDFPAAFQNGEYLDLAYEAPTLDVRVGYLHVRTFSVVEDFYTMEGDHSPIDLLGGRRAGQRFTATLPFDGIEVHGPTWSVDGQKGMTIRLWSWAGSYDATVEQDPLAVSVLEQLDDNNWHPCVADTTLEPGVYFWEISEPTNPFNPDDKQIGAWLSNESVYADGEAYVNGEPVQEVSATWVRLFGLDQTGTWTAFQFPGLPDDRSGSLGQNFEATEPFVGVGILSPTWNGAGAGYRMTLYRWTGDYASSVSGEVLARETFSNITDNGRNDMVWETPLEPGQYLVLTDNPVPSDTGLVGHWGWLFSPYAVGDVPAAFINDRFGDEIYELPSFDVYLAIPSEQATGKDFESRSIMDESGVESWSMY